MAESRKLRVFLCHASNDKPIVRELYQRLKAEGWIDPWLDEEKLLPGHDWDAEIEKAVEAADAVIVLLSNNSVTKEGYVQKELRAVLDVAEYKPEGAIFIIPLRLENCFVPRRLKNYHYQDYFPLEQTENGYRRLRRSLKIKADTSGIKISEILIGLRREVEAKAIKIKELRIRKEAEERIRREEEDMLRKKAEERARKSLERKLRKQADENARRELEEKKAREIEEKHEEEKKKRIAEEKERREKFESSRRSLEEIRNKAKNAFLYEARGDLFDALRLYREIHGVAPAFPEIAVKINEIEKKLLIREESESLAQKQVGETSSQKVEKLASRDAALLESRSQQSQTNMVVERATMEARWRRHDAEQSLKGCIIILFYTFVYAIMWAIPIYITASIVAWVFQLFSFSSLVAISEKITPLLLCGVFVLVLKLCQIYIIKWMFSISSFTVIGSISAAIYLTSTVFVLDQSEAQILAWTSFFILVILPIYTMYSINMKRNWIILSSITAIVMFALNELVGSDLQNPFTVVIFAEFLIVIFTLQYYAVQE